MELDNIRKWYCQKFSIVCTQVPCCQSELILLQNYKRSTRRNTPNTEKVSEGHWPLRHGRAVFTSAFHNYPSCATTADQTLASALQLRLPW